MTTKSDYPHPVVYLGLFFVVMFFCWQTFGLVVAWIAVTDLAMLCLFLIILVEMGAAAGKDVGG